MRLSYNLGTFVVPCIIVEWGVTRNMWYFQCLLCFDGFLESFHIFTTCALAVNVNILQEVWFYNNDVY